MGEELVIHWSKTYKIPAVSLRLFNVYGPRHIRSGEMATVIGIFEDQYINNKNLTIVKPGTQTRKFTHIYDTVKVCYEAWLKKRCAHYGISHKKSYSIHEVAKMFSRKKNV